MDQKKLRILIAVIWLVVAILSITRNQTFFAVLSFLVSGLFFYAAFSKKDNYTR